jgi:hypothetical protein
VKISNAGRHTGDPGNFGRRLSFNRELSKTYAR